MGGTVKNVVFVCVGNSCRSQMAEGFLQASGGDLVKAYSAGTHPAGVVSPLTVQVMEEKGIDISRQYSKGLDWINLAAMDMVITLGCCSANEICPVTYNGERVDWDIADPVGQSAAIYRLIRDEIEKKVSRLLDKIRAEAGAES